MTSKPQTDCNQDHRSGCPITCTLELIGDKWSLLLIRDIAVGGKHRYGDFENSPEHIPTNILADRLKRLIAHGVLEKRSYQQRPVRYAYLLTRKGAELIPVLQCLAKWGLTHNTGEWEPPSYFWQLTPEKVIEEQEYNIQQFMAMNTPRQKP